MSALCLDKSKLYKQSVTVPRYPSYDEENFDDFASAPIARGLLQPFHESFGSTPVAEP